MRASAVVDNVITYSGSSYTGRPEGINPRIPNKVTNPPDPRTSDPHTPDPCTPHPHTQDPHTPDPRTPDYRTLDLCTPDP